MRMHLPAHAGTVTSAKLILIEIIIIKLVLYKVREKTELTHYRKFNAPENDAI